MYYDVSLGNFIGTVVLSAMVLISVWVYGNEKCCDSSGFSIS